MKCKAKIQDPFGNKSSCTNDATDELTITTFAPHLNREIVKVKCLCKKHLKSVKKRHNYQIKHCGKKTLLKERNL